MIRTLALFYAASDINRARRLFESALGIEFREEHRLETFTCFVAEPCLGMALELHRTGRGESTRTMLEFEVADIDAVAAALTAAGFEVRRRGRVALVSDPNGNTIALSRPARAPRR